MTELPDGWREEALGDLAHGGLFVDGDWVETKDQDPTGGVRLTQLADVGVAGFRDRSDRWMRADQAAALNCTYLQPGDILVARMPEPLGRACLVPTGLGTAVTAVDVAVLRVARADVDPRYVMWALNGPSAREHMVQLQSGTTRKRISRKNLATVKLPLPPLREQRRIVGILEDHLSRLDAAHSSLSTARTRLETYKASVRDMAATGGAGRVRVGANLPAGWRWALVEEFADPAKGSMTIGPFGSNLKVADYRESGVPLVFVKNVRTAAFGSVGCRYVTLEKAKELRAHRVEPGDVVITKMGDPPGDAAVYRADGPGVVTADVIRIRPAAGVDPDYLALALNSGLVRQQIADITRGVAQQKVSLARYRSEVLVPTPAFDAQAAVATTCAEDLASASRAETVISALEAKLSALRRSLLAAAFSGRLVRD